jgi:cytochrome c2
MRVMVGFKAFGGLAALAALVAVPVVVSAQAPAQGKPDPVHGEQVFEDMCIACHIKAGGGQAPTLVGVVGRPSASVPGAVYSKALQAAHLTWTTDQLDKFLTDPAVTVPGTAMPMSVPDDKDRADLIAFLASPANKP